MNSRQPENRFQAALLPHQIPTPSQPETSIIILFPPPTPRMCKMSNLTQDQLKQIAAAKAVEFVPENEYIGIGTGSTVNFFS